MIEVIFSSAIVGAILGIIWQWIEMEDKGLF